MHDPRGFMIVVRAYFYRLPWRRVMSSNTIDTAVSEGKRAEDDDSRKAKRQFDFSMWNKRHVAFRVMYLGWNYHGLAAQETTPETIEAKLFECLLKAKLIEDPAACNYSRCGRTDKGVSAFGQVIALDVRSALLEGPGLIVNDDNKAKDRKGDKSVEIPYVQILNRLLPEDIRIISWTPVEYDFSARFSCLHRVYKYFFPMGTMNIELMRRAAEKLTGEHDFRNFCKMDIGGGVTNFVRNIQRFTLSPIDDSPLSSCKLYEFTVTGNAFLWHQVRCMVGILFLIGNGLEIPEVIDHMLDIKKCTRKPQYGMAAEYPLVLYDCVYKGINWEKDDITYKKVISHFQQLWTKQMLYTTMIKRMLDGLHDDHHTPVPIVDYVSPLVKADHRLGGPYKSLLTRPTSDTFEERYEVRQAKKRKLEEGNQT